MDKQQFLKQLDLSVLRQKQETILAALDAANRKVISLKEELSKASENVELVKADLMLTEEYKSGKNAEIREAWLITQRRDNSHYRSAVASMLAAEQKVAEAEAEVKKLTNDYSFVKSQYKNAGAILAFLAD